jgi:hypothetical protein
VLNVSREGWLGDYDFKYLCMPTMPFGKGKGRRKPPPFYSLNADLPMLLALVCGESPCDLVIRRLIVQASSTVSL